MRRERAHHHRSRRETIPAWALVLVILLCIGLLVVHKRTDTQQSSTSTAVPVEKEYAFYRVLREKQVDLSPVKPSRNAETARGSGRTSHGSQGWVVEGAQELPKPVLENRGRPARSHSGDQRVNSPPAKPAIAAARKPRAVTEAIPMPPATPARFAAKSSPSPLTHKERARASRAAPAYLLQAGAFQSKAQAEALKVRIAWLGYVSRIEPLRIGDRTLYRVRLGPYRLATEMEKAKERLELNGIPGIPISLL